MAGRDRWLRTLRQSLEDQGCRVRSSRKALFVALPPGGGMISVHQSPSDYRAVKNLRRDVERHGLTWPFPSDNPP